MIKQLVEAPWWTMSFEVFPPRSEDPDKRADVLSRVGQIAEFASKLQPSAYMSVTHRAGTTFDNTLEACKVIRDIDSRIPVVAHMTTVGATKDEVIRRLEKAKQVGVSSILALRGDYPEGYNSHESDFETSLELVEFIKEHSDFEVGASFYPEGYDKESSALAEMYFNTMKIGSGASYLVGQMCFDKDRFRKSYNELKEICPSGVYIPGVMPMLTENMFTRCESSNVTIPTYEKVKYHYLMLNDDATGIREYGENLCVHDIMDMYTVTPHVHLYTMNDVSLVNRVYTDLRYLIGR